MTWGFLLNQVEAAGDVRPKIIRNHLAALDDNHMLRREGKRGAYRYYPGERTLS